MLRNIKVKLIIRKNSLSCYCEQKGLTLTEAINILQHYIDEYNIFEGEITDELGNQLVYMKKNGDGKPVYKLNYKKLFS